MAWLTNWNRRKLITVNGSSAGQQSNYQMSLIVNQGSGTDSAGTVYLGNNVIDSPAFADLRFTKSDGSTLLSYWIEYISGSSPNQTAKVWIKLAPSPDLIPTSPGIYTFYLYYNNPSATSASDGSGTFIFFDNFPGSGIDTNKWTVDAGINPGPSGQFPSGNYGVTSNYWWTCYATSNDMSIAITSKNNIVDINKSIDFGIQVVSYTSGTAWNNAQRYAYFHYYSSTPFNEVDLAYPYPGNPNYVLYPINTGTIYNIQIAYTSSSQAKVYVNGNFWGNLALNGVPAKAVFQARDLHLTSACMNVRLYNVRTRSYVYPEPSWSTISAEQLPIYSAVVFSIAGD